MRKLIYFIILILASGQVQAQKLSIIDALHLNEELEYKTRKPLKIIQKTTSFNLNDRKSSDKIIKTFDESGLLKILEFYGDNDSLFGRVTYVNDTVNRIKLSMTMDLWSRNGVNRETSIYTYNKNNFLEGTTDIDDNGKIIRKTKITCNEKGHPTELRLFDSKGKLYSTEKATYFYKKNKVLRTVQTSDGLVLNEDDSSKISLRNENQFPGVNEVCNNNGDLIRWKGKNFVDKDWIYERVYNYDEFGNWIESKIFQITTGSDGNPIRKVKQIVLKEYFY